MPCDRRWRAGAASAGFRCGSLDGSHHLVPVAHGIDSLCSPTGIMGHCCPPAAEQSAAARGALKSGWASHPAPVESVDRWPLAIATLRHTRGYACVPVSASRRDRGRAASSWGDDARAPLLRRRVLERTSLWGIRSRQLDGALVRTAGLTPGREAAPGACTPPRTIDSGRRSRGPLTIVTWLILPVVICLSQRLSHACLSISNLYGETANGSLNQLSFI